MAYQGLGEYTCDSCERSLTEQQRCLLSNEAMIRFFNLPFYHELCSNCYDEAVAGYHWRKRTKLVEWI